MSGFVEWNDNGQDLWFTFVKDTPNRFRVSGGTAFKVDGDSSKNQYTVLHDIRWDPSSDKPFQGVSHDFYTKPNEYLSESLIDRMHEEAYRRGLNNVVVDKAKNGGLGSSSSLSLGGRDSDIFYLDARDGLRSGDVIQPEGSTGSTVEGHDAFGLYESPEPLYRHGANMEQTVYRVQAVDYDSASDQAISKNSHIDRADAYASTVIVLGPSESSDW